MEDQTIRLRAFSLHATSPEYAALKDECKRRDIKPFEAMAMGTVAPAYIVSKLDGVHITPDLNPLNVFSNQFNATVSGKDKAERFFDCRIFYEPTPYGGRTLTRNGYICEPGPGYDALNALRVAYLECGYCGARHEAHLGKTWCDRCLSSQYLKPGDLPLLALHPLYEHNPNRSRAVPQYLRKQYEAAQAVASKTRADKMVRDKLQALEDRKTHADIEIAVLTTLGNHGLHVRYFDNLIYYPHTGTFTFGWRTPLSDDEAKSVREALDSTGLSSRYTFEIKT